MWRLSPALGPRRYSYVAVLAAVAVGALAPSWAGWVLGPAVVAGLVLLGVAHGACDQYVVPATRPALARDRGRYWAVFLVAYLGLAAAVGVVWCWWPGLAVAGFFGLSAWHWGSADAPAGARYRGQWLMHSILRGALLFAVPLWCWPATTRHLIDGLLALAGAVPLRPAAVALAAQYLGPAVLGGHLLLWAGYWRTGQSALAATDMAEALLLSVLLAVLPPVLSAGVYFVFWHSLQHVLRMNGLMGRPVPATWAMLRRDTGFFLRRAAPLLLVSLAALGGIYAWVWVRMGSSGPVFISVALLVASVVTLPHALLVTLGLDAAPQQARRVPLRQAVAR